MAFFVLALIEFFRLRRFADPTGADGYFYLKQIQSLSGHATFYYRDYSLAFLPPALLNLMVREPLLTYQVTTLAVFGGIGAVGARIAARVATDRGPGAGSRVWAGVSIAFAVLFFAFGNLSLELTLVFLKTAFAALALLLFWDFAVAGRNRAAIAAAVAAVLSHKLMLVLVPAAALFLSPAFGISSIRGSRKRVGIGAAVVLGAFAILGIAAFVQRGFFEHLRHLLGATERLGFGTDVFARMPTAAFFAILLFLVAILAFALARNAAGRALRFLLFAGGLALFAVALPGGLDTESLKYRLELVAVPFFPVITAIAIRGGGRFRAAGVALAALPIALGLVFDRPLRTWVTPWSGRFANVDRIAEVLPPDALLYAPHGAEFYLAYRTPFRPRSLRIDARGREVYRVAYVAPYLATTGALKDDLETSALLKLGSEFFLFREADWTALNRIHLFIPHPMNLLPKKPDFVADYED